MMNVQVPYQPSWPSTQGGQRSGTAQYISTTQHHMPTAQHMQPSQPSYEGYRLEVIQQPLNGKVAIGKEKDRKPLDPPPFVKLTVDDTMDPHKHFLQSPYLLVCCYLEAAGNSNRDDDPKTLGSMLTGTTASSLHRLKDMQNTDGAYFVFPDLTVKKEGDFKLRFVLMNMEEDKDRIEPGGGSWVTICETRSHVFTVHNPRSFPGMAESTFLTRCFSDQGVRLRLRKDSRALTTRKRNNAVAQLATRHKRSADADAGGNEQMETQSHRGSLPSHERGFYEPQSHYDEPSSKKQRTISGSGPSYSMHNTLPYSGMQSSGGYPSATGYPTSTGYPATAGFSAAPAPLDQTPPYLGNSASPQMQYPRDPFPHGLPQVAPPMGPPRPGTAHIDTQVPSTYHRVQQNGIFPSPPGRQSPANTFNYSASPNQVSPSMQHTPTAQQIFFGRELPPMNAQSMHAGNPHANTSPHSNSHSGTPVSNTGSPTDQGYTLAQGPFSAGYTTQGAYDQGLAHENGLPTPVTGDMRSESMHNQYTGGLMHHEDNGGYGGIKAVQDS